MKAYLRLAGFLFAFFAGSTSVFAYSFPFREFSEGDSVPDVTLSRLRGQRTISFSQFKGRPFVSIFWGADLPAKLERAAKMLAEIETLSSFFAERDIQLISVNAQGDSPDIIQKVITLSQSTLPVYLDEGKKAYGALGIFVMPTILVVDENGNASAGMGYSHDIISRLKGAVEIMLAEKTPEQVQAELRPEMAEKSSQEKNGTRHLNFGLELLKDGMTDRAMSEFQKALELNKNLTQAHIEAGCLYVEKDQLNNAAEELQIGLELAPDSLQGRLCQGELKMKTGQLDDAAKDLKAIQEETPSAPKPHYLLGKVYEAQRMPVEAAEEYKNAYFLLNKIIDDQK